MPCELTNAYVYNIWLYNADFRGRPNKKVGREAIAPPVVMILQVMVSVHWSTFLTSAAFATLIALASVLGFPNGLSTRESSFNKRCSKLVISK